MKILIGCLLLATFGIAQATPQSPLPSLSPAERRLADAKKGIEAKPEQYQLYNSLALAFIARAQETSDPTFYSQSEEALKKSFSLLPGNFEGRKIQVVILLSRHEFARARDQARVLNRQTPDDVLVYGYVADAGMQLGDYEEAEQAAQWMLDLRPGNIPGLMRGADLRTVYGDIEGANEFLVQAYQEAPPSETAELAAILTQVADLQLMSGQVLGADKTLQQALATFPEYPPALVSLARVRMAQHEYAKAADLLRQRNQRPPRPEIVYMLAKALQDAGRRDEARAAYADFEQKALAQTNNSDNANRELVFYYADHAHKPAEALRIARLEMAKRHNVNTLDAYAWALYVNGEFAEARAQLNKALAVGIRDATFFYHAGKISSKLNDEAATEHYFRQSLDLNSSSEVSAAARADLDMVAPVSSKTTAPANEKQRQ